MCVYDVCHLCLEYLEKERQPCQCPPPFFSSLHLSSPLHLFFFPPCSLLFPGSSLLWFPIPSGPLLIFLSSYLLIFSTLLCSLPHYFLCSSRLLSSILHFPMSLSIPSFPLLPLFPLPPLFFCHFISFPLLSIPSPLSDMQYNEVTKYSSVQRLLPVPIVELTEGWFHLYVVLSNSPIFHRQILQGS